MIDSSIAQGHPQTTFTVWDRQTTHESSQNSLAMQNMNSINTELLSGYIKCLHQFQIKNLNAL